MATQTEVNVLFDAAVAADKEWTAEIEKAFPREWPGDVRYRVKAEGLPGTPLRAVFEKSRDAAAAWREAAAEIREST